ncbi:3-methyladenine DNA glycosylase [Fervidicella metallireducens AeB]|uniref:DNA-3-methyladenine glycosylase II n=1 Tax=Fervidicella metallireducens AeB TaxID=1403537 RepID=A0A017RRH8_9CLOT|nr:DNA-3-methyladenine glycosylase [Fervidicella metallireducens]EYE87257.1 3-methyladenine DNA glycosylase [Fervidicella metallireducens AeB]
MNFFKYGEDEINYLSSKDDKLRKFIEEIGPIKREVIPDTFQALISSIVYQQISTKAGDTVWKRLNDSLVDLTPENIIKATDEQLRECGLSGRKVSYLKSIALAAKNKTVDFENLHMLSDEEIIKKLVGLYGVGVWTAEMLLIFSLNRMDVLSFNDLGIKKGLMKLHGLNEISKEDFQKFKKIYSPYASVASLYLWEICRL